MTRDAPPPLTLNAWLRYDVAIRLLRRRTGVHTVLEIGAGEGGMAWRLARRYRYLGLEPDSASFARAQHRLREVPSATLRNIRVEDLPPDSTFDLVCAFEVLEHFEDDDAILAGWRSRVHPGGWILLSVPAWPSQWGKLDEKAGHYRRYEPSELEALLARTGFADPVVEVYGFPLTYALQPLWNLAARFASVRRHSMEERTAASGRWLQPPEALGFVTQAVSAPFRLIQRPFAQTKLGTGLVALARRP